MALFMIPLAYSKLNRGQWFKLAYIRNTIYVKKSVYSFFMFVSYARQSVDENAG